VANWIRAIANAATAAVALSLTHVAVAQDYPTRPITIMVGISPGGITDVTTRIYAEAVSKRIGQRIVIENRTGGGGAVAATAVQNAAPDGYTLLAFLGSQQSAVPAIQKVGFDPIAGFQPISLLFNLVTFIAVPADSPVNTMAELLAYGKKKDGGLTFGSPGLGTPSHLLAARIARASGTPVRYVHYRGGSPMLADLVSGRVDFALPTFTVAKSYVADKKLKILAIDAAERSPAMPDVPTLTEVGFGQEKVASWVGVSAPAGTPAHIVRMLNEAFVKAASDPDLKQRLAANGTPIVTSSPDEMGRLLKEEVEKTNELVSVLGIRQQ
jgi:tripartite-type tricarboxylate transporter receptor subunit TctC